VAVQPGLGMRAARTHSASHASPSTVQDRDHLSALVNPGVHIWLYAPTRALTLKDAGADLARLDERRHVPPHDSSQV